MKACVLIAEVHRMKIGPERFAGDEGDGYQLAAVLLKDRKGRIGRVYRMREAKVPAPCAREGDVYA